MIELRDISISSGSFALHDVSFALQTGEYIALMGRTGQGKTTILEAIAGLRQVTKGTILIEGRDVTRLPPAQRGAGYVPQDLALFPTMTVRENIGFALHIRGKDAQLIDQRVQTLAEWLSISHLLDRRVTNLSGGEAQRTALGRALSFEPKVLLLDEPFSALDDETREAMHQAMRLVRERTHVSVLHVTHNQSEATALADRVLRVEGGSIVPA